MTTTQESGRHVTPERIRADGANVERAGFRLVYRRPIEQLRIQDRQRRIAAARPGLDYMGRDVEDDYPRPRWSWWESESWHGFSESIPGEDGRMA